VFSIGVKFIIHLTLANLYSQAGNQEKVQDQVNQLIELKEKYPFLEKYFRHVSDD